MGAYLGFDHNKNPIDISNEIGLSGVFGLFGSSCSIEDKVKRHKIESAISRYLTLSDKRDLVSGMESEVTPTANAMAYFFLGGKDCKHKNVSPGDQRFLDRLPPLIEKRATEAQQKKQQAYQQPEPSTGNTEHDHQKVSPVNTSQEIPNKQAESFSLTENQKLYVAIGTGLFVLAGTAIALK